MAQLEHIEAIEKRLWSAADTLRANSNFAAEDFSTKGAVFLLPEAAKLAKKINANFKELMG